MANPQPDQYTKISNELMEQIPYFKFNGTQLRILFVVMRYTYGFCRKDWELSLTFISTATGIHKTQIKKEVKNLIDKKVILESKAPSFNSTRRLGLNKDYDNWLIAREQITPLVANYTPGSEKGHTQGANYTPDQGANYTPKKEINKTINKEEEEEESDQSLKQIEKVWIENGFGTMPTSTAIKISSHLDTIPTDLFIHIIENAAEHNGRTWAYIDRVLQVCYQNNIFTVADFDRRQAEHKQKKSSRGDKKSKSERDQEIMNSW